MRTWIPSLLGVIYVVSEFTLSVARRAKENESALADRGSLNLIWIVILPSVTLAFVLVRALPSAGMGGEPAMRYSGVVLFALGLALRWYAIVYLGRFFTVNVAIAADHRLIDTGPYRYVRHPSYTGALMAFLGLALCLGNWASLAAVLIPVVVVFMRRVLVEEAALEQAFGDRYRDYMNRTKRLIPAIY